MYNRPYLVPGSDRISLGEWTRRSDAEWVPLDVEMLEWNPGTDLDIARTYQIDVSAVIDDCGLSEHSAIRIAVSWFSDSTKMGGMVALDVVVDANQRTIRGRLDGMEIGGLLTLRTTVTAVPAAGSEDGAPQSPGTVLYEDSQLLVLGGDDGKFPVCVDDFATTGYDPDASWFLEVDTTDLTSSFISAAVLHINSRDKKLVQATVAETPTSTQKTLLRELSHGLSAHLLYMAMEVDRVEALEEPGSWPFGSLGAMFALLLEQSDLSAANLNGGIEMQARLRARVEGITRRQGKGRAF